MAMSFKPSGIPRYIAGAVIGVMTLLQGATVLFLVKKDVPDTTAAPVVIQQWAISGASIALNSPRANINTRGTLTMSGHLVLKSLGANDFLRSTSTGMIAPATSTPVTLANADSYYVNDSGDSMTGALLVQIKTNGAAATADAGVALEVVGSLSGAIIFAQAGLATSGSLTVSGDALLGETRGVGNVIFTFASDTADETLRWLNLEDRFEFSDDLAVTGNFTATGTLKSDGSITTEGDLTLNEDQTNANTVLTFGSDSVNETLTFLNAADRFEFSDDLNATGDLYSSGSLIVYGRILSKNSGGASGTLVINGGAISATLGDHITIRPEGAGLFRAPKDITWSDDADTADATGSGNVFAIPDSMSGGIIVDWAGNVATAGVTNLATWQIINQTDGCDIFSTKITIDSTEKSTSTAATAAVINTACNTFTTDDVLILRTDVAQTTAAKGKAIRITIAPR
jgi:hypothetical protein